jgi:hypothetical protein
MWLIKKDFQGGYQSFFTKRILLNSITEQNSHLNSEIYYEAEYDVDNKIHRNEKDAERWRELQTE